jgi:hypothetical protein
MSEYIHKSHSISVLNLVFPAKYRRVVFDESVDRVLKEVCRDISTSSIKLNVIRSIVVFVNDIIEKVILRNRRLAQIIK